MKICKETWLAFSCAIHFRKAEEKKTDKQQDIMNTYLQKKGLEINLIVYFIKHDLITFIKPLNQMVTLLYVCNIHTK